jgi:hypothetical protein
MPKSNRRPSNRQVKTIDELHSGQYTTGIGIPPNLSLIISCLVKIANGYAPALPLMITPITGALSSIFSAHSSAKSANFRLSIDEIPSLEDHRIIFH